MDNFDLKKYLVENKVTRNSRIVNENKEALAEVSNHFPAPEGEWKGKDMNRWEKWAEAIAKKHGMEKEQYEDFLTGVWESDSFEYYTTEEDVLKGIDHDNTIDHTDFYGKPDYPDYVKIKGEY